MQGIAQYTLLRKAWALRGSFCRWQKIIKGRSRSQ